MGYKGVDCTLVATAELISRGPLARIQTIIFAGDEKRTRFSSCSDLAGQGDIAFPVSVILFGRR